MISIQSVVEKTLKNDAEAYSAMKRGIMNFSQYAHDIHAEIEKICKKDVRHGSIVISLTRLAGNNKIGSMKSYAPPVVINNITTKMPVTEIVFDKTPEALQKLSALFTTIKTPLEDFFVMTYSTQEITIICSDTILKEVKKIFTSTPKMEQGNLAAIGLSFDEKYYTLPNITFSLIRQLALKEIVIAETVSSYTEVVFICHYKDVSTVLESFSK